MTNSIDEFLLAHANEVITITAGETTLRLFSGEVMYSDNLDELDEYDASLFGDVYWCGLTLQSFSSDC